MLFIGHAAIGGVMDASSRTILGLISEMNVRFVVPVYQRPYSWGEEQCVQLWDDILSAGRRRSSHFTGSIVTIRDGEASRGGVASLLLIDGQQRMTTIALLLIALARYAGSHPDRCRSFSCDEILMSGYLTNHFRSADDHYKLTLSKGDVNVYRALVDALERGEEPAIGGDSLLSRNLALLERRVEALDSVDLVWEGLQRLEVVAISLTQGHDDPQLIFESMNATGKDLATADLVRNFVLMNYPLDEQRDVYRTFWAPIERILGEDAFDVAFDAFLACYLDIAYAPTSLAGADAYQAFKRYVLFHGYDEHDRMKNLSLRMKRFARYFVAVTRGRDADDELAQAFCRIARLGVPAANPLLVALYDGYDHKEFSKDEFLRLLGVLESYLVRRAVCDCAGSELGPFLLSLVARVDAVRSEEGEVAPALLSMLLNEEGTPRRFPSDAEFSHALRTRDAYGFEGVRDLLAWLECHLNPDAAGRMEGGRWTVEHVMPVRALEDPVWRDALGDLPEQAYQSCVNNLGNLTLSSSEFDLQEGSLEDKQARLSKDGLSLSADVLAATAWTPVEVARRAEALADLAVEAWPLPVLPEGAGREFRLSERAAATRSVSFADLFAAGLVEMDDALVSVSPLYPGRATVTSTGKIMLANGEMFEDPDAAYERFLTSAGATFVGQSGWMYWRRGDGGPLLDDLRGKIR